jgi:hypothetical protein
MHLAIEEKTAFIAFQAPAGRKHACVDVLSPAGSLQGDRRNGFRPKTCLSESRVNPFNERAYRHLSTANKKTPILAGFYLTMSLAVCMMFIQLNSELADGPRHGQSCETKPISREQPVGRSREAADWRVV